MVEAFAMEAHTRANTIAVALRGLHSSRGELQSASATGQSARGYVPTGSVGGSAAPRAGSLGIHWGNRYLLILYPLCAALAAANLAHWWNHRVGKASASLPALAAVLLLSCPAQAYSNMLLKSKKDFSVRLNQAIQQRPETAVVSNIRWAPQAMYSAFYDKSMFFVESPEHLNRLARTLAGRGYDRFLFVAQSDQDYAMPQAVQVRDELRRVPRVCINLSFFEVLRQRRVRQVDLVPLLEAAELPRQRDHFCFSYVKNSKLLAEVELRR